MADETTKKINWWGSYPFQVDLKHRASFPAPFLKDLRERGQSQLVLVPSLSQPRHIEAWPLDGWQEQMDLVETAPDDELRTVFYRHYVGKHMKASIDQQGRVTLSASIRSALHLTDREEISWVGVGEYAELWTVRMAEQDYQNITPSAPAYLRALRENHRRGTQTPPPMNPGPAPMPGSGSPQGGAAPAYYPQQAAGYPPPQAAAWPGQYPQQQGWPPNAAYPYAPQQPMAIPQPWPQAAPAWPTQPPAPGAPPFPPAPPGVPQGTPPGTTPGEGGEK